MEINKGTRIINFTIDYIVIYLFATLFFIFIDPRLSGLIFYIIYFIYYFSFELIKGQTIGKMITKTTVVDANNLKPSAGRIFYRTILRLNPFDSFTYIFGQEQGGHDLISRTRLVNRKKKD